MDLKSDSTVNNEGEKQPLQQQQQQYDRLWLLVEWEMQNDLNSYAIIESSEVIGHRNIDNMHTGKTIYVVRENKVVPATIVIISDDKQFLDTELKQLNRMSAVNLNKSKSTSNGNSVKRRRVNQSLSVSSNGDNISDKKTPLSPGATVAWPNCNGGDRIIGPSMPTNGYSNKSIPPMTFHQQTQTDFKLQTMDPTSAISLNDIAQIKQQLAQLKTQQDSIMDDQKNLRVVSNINNQYLVDLSEQMSDIKSLLKDFPTKFHTLDKFEITQVETASDNNFVVLETSPNSSTTTTSNTNNNTTAHSANNNKNDTDIIDSKKNMAIEEEISLSSSDLQLNRDGTPLNLNKNRSLSNMSLNQNLNNMILQDLIKNDWNDSNISDEDLVPIGCNKTMIAKYILRSINWSSYKAATRRLLITLFPRNVLASHSLTGKPSPAFHDREKPIKNKLDPIIVADIIQTVTKYCNVPENVVRTAITTKCADENKMSRQRIEKQIQRDLKLKKGDKILNANKENTI